MKLLGQAKYSKDFVNIAIDFLCCPHPVPHSSEHVSRFPIMKCADYRNRSHAFVEYPNEPSSHGYCSSMPPFQELVDILSGWNIAIRMVRWMTMPCTRLAKIRMRRFRSAFFVSDCIPCNEATEFEIRR